MEETSQAKDDQISPVALSDPEQTVQLSRADYYEAEAASKKLKGSHTSGDDVMEAGQTTVGLRDAVKLLPDTVKKEILKRLPKKQTMLLSRAHYSEAIAESKKLKSSHDSGDGLLELNVPTKVPSMSIGESKQLVSGWTYPRMLIPPAHGVVDLDQVMIDSVNEDTEAKIRIYHNDGVRVVVVLAEEDPRSPTSPALESFVTAQMLFVNAQTYFPKSAAFRLIRLLITAGQARALIHDNFFQTIVEKSGCFFYIYLTDNVSILSVGDAIVELQGLPERIILAAKRVACYLRKFPVEKNKISELERIMNSTHGDSPPNNEASASGGASGWKFPKVKAERSFEVQRCIGVPFSYVEDIMGDEGANIGRIQESTRASIFVAPGDRPDYARFYIFGDEVEDVEEARKVLASIIGKEDFFEDAYENFFVLRSPSEGEADSLPLPSSDEEGDDASSGEEGDDTKK